MSRKYTIIDICIAIYIQIMTLYNFWTGGKVDGKAYATLVSAAGK